MQVRSLGYIGLDVADLDAWRSYAQLLGTMTTGSPHESGFWIKTDDRPFRIVVEQTSGEERLAFAGWEVHDAVALDQTAASLAAAGYPVEAATGEEREQRRVRGLVRTTDPGGFQLEFYWGPIHNHELFISPAGVTEFVTGEMGLGHIVLGTTAFSEAIEFYTGLLGFRVSDYMGSGNDQVVFTRCNPRHHSLALVPAEHSTLYHFMLEVATLDDVGHALERHEVTGAPISMGLGRHSNDRMVSFYSRSPSGFDVEFGFGGIRVNESLWSPSEITRPSIWGHRRV